VAAHNATGVWATALHQGDGSPVHGEVAMNAVVDHQELVKHFGKKEKEPVAAPQPKKTEMSKPDAYLCLLSHSRSQNVQIMLARWKMTFEEICTAILQVQPDFVTQDRVESLCKCCPSEEELKLVMEHNQGSTEAKLGYTERFFCALGAIPRLPDKVQALSLYVSFKDEIAHIVASDKVIRQATLELHHSKKLVRLLHLILHLGNALNHGTSRGDAGGFKMDTLLKLSALWSRDHKVTFLRYIVQVVDSKVPSLAQFYEELPSVRRACEMSGEMMQQHRIQLNALRQQVSAAAGEVLQCRELGSETFAATLGGFVEQSRQTLDDVEAMLAETDAAYTGMLEYYGESKESQNGGKLFDTIHEFCIQFKNEQEVLTSKGSTSTKTSQSKKTAMDVLRD